MRSIFLIGLFLILTLPALAGDAPGNQLRRKIRDLHDDSVEDNCRKAMEFLTKHASEPKVQAALLEEYYKTTDPQAKEECMVLLSRARGFQPDEKFIREVLTRMHHYGKPEALSSGEPAGNTGALLVAANATRFKELIASELADGFQAKDNTLWMQYAIIRALAKAHILDDYADRFSPAYLKRLAENLQDDTTSLNARVAASAFIFLGKHGASALRDVPQSANLQGRQLALLLLSYVTGSIDLPALGVRLNQLQYFDIEQQDLEDFNPAKRSNEDVSEGPPPPFDLPSDDKPAESQ